MSGWQYYTLQSSIFIAASLAAVEPWTKLFLIFLAILYGITGWMSKKHGP